jgi:hypothetical protein
VLTEKDNIQIKLETIVDNGEMIKEMELGNNNSKKKE